MVCYVCAECNNIKLKAATELQNAKSLARSTMKWRSQNWKNEAHLLHLFMKDKAQFVVETLGKLTEVKLSKLGETEISRYIGT